MFPTYPEGWDSCQRADRVTEPHLITKSSFVLSFATTPHPGAVVPRMLGGHRAPTATPGMAKKRVLVQGELHFPFLTAEKACLGPPRINKTRSPSSRGHDLLHQAFPSHAAGIAQRRPRSAAISQEQGPAEPRLARGWAPPAKSHPGVSAKSLRAPELEMHHAVNPPALGKQTAVEEGEEEATGDGKHPWAAGSPNPSLTRCRQELKEADEPSRLLPLPNSSA